METIYVRSGDEILERMILDNGTIIETHHCFFMQINLEVEKNVVFAGESATVNITVKDWKGNFIMDKDAIEIRISNNDTGVTTETIPIKNGMGSFEFESEFAGEFVIKVLEPNCDKNKVIINVE